MADQVILPFRVLDTSGDPVSGARVYFYRSGTDTALTAYTTSALSTAHDRPLVSDSAGFCALAFTDGTYSVRARIYDGSGNELFDIDPIQTSGIGSSASQISFAPITGNGADDVQDAIANNTAAIIAVEESDGNSNALLGAGGTGNAFTITPPTAITAYSVGQAYYVYFGRAPTGASTLNVSGIGTAAIKKYNSSGTKVDIAANDWARGAIKRLIYDGTEFVIAGPVNASETERGLVEKASSAENVAGTATGVFPDVAGVVEIVETQRPVVTVATGLLDTDAATVAWLARNGFSATVTKNGTGDYTVNLSTAQPNANYTVQATCNGNQRYFASIQNRTTTSFDIIALSATGTAFDPPAINLLVTR
jgi:hypothetical protein